jgi:hypothetical protein
MVQMDQKGALLGHFKVFFVTPKKNIFKFFILRLTPKKNLKNIFFWRRLDLKKYQKISNFFLHMFQKKSLAALRGHTHRL